MELIEQLAQEFNQNTVLFIGSGVSLSSGLPTWGQLIEWLRDYANDLGSNLDAADAFIKRKDLINASSVLTMELQKLGKTLSEFFIEYPKCKLFETAEPSEVHDLLLRLPTNSIITPNYDLLLEKAYLKKLGADIQVVHKNDPDTLNEINRRKLKTFLYKYHGCITKSENIILNFEHYNAEINKLSPDKEFLKGLIQSRVFVFIGAGLEDPDFKNIRDYILQINQPQNIEFWAFMRNCQVEVDYYKQQYGTNLINYGGEDRDHSDLLNKLSDLAKNIYELDKKKLSDVDIFTKQKSEPIKHGETLRQTLVSANEKILPVDEQILGFIAFFNGIERSECEDYMIGFKNKPRGLITNRIDYLVSLNLIKTTEYYLLPIKGSFSVEAAELIEDDIIEFLEERENGQVEA